MSKLLQSYLRFFAKHYLKRAKPQIIAVTGSVGKTSTKNAIFEVLKIQYGLDVRKSEGNLNNETGVPLAILGIKKSPSNPLGWLPILIAIKFKALFSRKVTHLVLEFAADKPGDITYLTSFVKPDIVVITSIGHAHLEAFGTIEKVIAEKTSILEGLSKDGAVVLNIDDKYLAEVKVDNFRASTYAINKEADFCARNIFTAIDNFQPTTKFQIITPKEKFLAEVHSLGLEANIYSALAACAVAFLLGIKKETIIQGLGNFKNDHHRMEVFKGKLNSIIVDDSYNANPLSMRSALDTLKHLSAKRKIVVIGDMREIGHITDQAHHLIGEYAREVADVVVGVGDLAKKYQADRYFENSTKATEYLLSEVKEGDMILIKASRAIGLDKIAKELKS